MFNTPRTRAMGNSTAFTAASDPLASAMDDPWSNAPSPASSKVFHATATSPATSAPIVPIESPYREEIAAGGVGNLQYSSNGERNLIPEDSVPTQYIVYFDALDHDRTGQVSMTSLYRLLSTSKLSPSVIERIINLVSSPTAETVSRQQFFVALGLVGLAQNDREISIERLSDTQSSLPTPILRLPIPSMIGSSEDVGGFNSLPRGLGRGISTTSSNGSAWGPIPVPPQDDSTGFAKPHPNLNGGASGPSDGDSLSAPSYVDPSGEARGLYGAQEGMKGWWKDLVKVEVMTIVEKEGWFLRKYKIQTSKRPGESVNRRYNDFAWLLDVLHKRYPFRLLPNLPPKRISPDGNFLEHRRRTLQRLLTFVVNHPVLKSDGALGVFLSEHNFEAWRKRNKVSYDEESTNKKVDSTTEMGIPADLDQKLENFRTILPDLLDSHTKLVILAEKSIKRLEVAAADQSRLAITLASIGERLPESCWKASGPQHTRDGMTAPSCELCRGVGSGLSSISDTMSREGMESENRSKALLLGSLEDLKRQRDLYVAFRDLFYRHDRLSKDSVDSLRKRVETKQKRLDIVRSARKPSWEVEEEKLVSVIEQDNAEIERSLARRVYNRYCMWNEYSVVFHSRQAGQTTRGWRTYTKDHVEAVKGSVERWDQLGDRLQKMPVD